MKIKTLKQLKITCEKNTIFVTPEYTTWQSLYEHNFKTNFNQIAKSEIQSQLLHIARQYTLKILPNWQPQKSTSNLIVTGHQPTWHHPGILAKNIIAQKFAKQIKGTCIHLVVDHDIEDTDIALPFLKDNQMLDFIKIPIETNKQNIPLELRRKPGMDILHNLVQTIKQNCPQSFCCNYWPEYLKKHSQTISSLKNIAEVITALQSALNNALGINMIYLPISLMSQSNIFMEFTTSIIKNYEQFTNIYNTAISKAPVQNKFKLLNTDDAGKTALPFWLVTACGLRTCIYLKRIDHSTIEISTISRNLGQIDLTDNMPCQLKNILNKYQLSLRPKAVTMMLFVRLFLADFFVHGIGGGIYKEITNFVLNNYYNIKKTNIAVATSTTPLPFLKQPCHNYDIEIINKNIRQTHHSPEKYIEKKLLEENHIKKIIETKKRAILQAGNPQKTKKEKQDAWKKINKINSILIKYAQPALKKFERDAKLAEQFKQSEKVANYRQFFLGLFPKSFLDDFTNNNTTQ